MDFLFLTHVHLDHAGGAGALMQALPGATAVLHPRGVAHMADPSKLIEATRAVYGEELYAQLYGEILPIARERIAIAQDGQRFEFAGRVFECVHTPGHALHHQAFVDYGATCIFTGDTFGLSYREFDTAAGPVDHAHHHADAVRSRRSSRRRSCGSCSTGRVGYISRTTAKSGSAPASPMTCTMPSTCSCSIARTTGLDLRRMRFEMRAWALTSLRASRRQADGSTPSTSILDKDFELNAAGLAAWLKREGN